MALSVSCTCCALVIASAECCGYLCYPTAVKRLWPLWSNPVPLSLIRCTCVVPLFLRCCVIRHMVLIALKHEKVLRLPLRSYRLYNRLSQFRFDIGLSSRLEKIMMDIFQYRTCCSRLTKLLTSLNQRWMALPWASSCLTTLWAINVMLTMHCQQKRCQNTQIKAGLTKRTDQRRAMEHLVLIKCVKNFITCSTILWCLAGSRAWNR